MNDRVQEFVKAAGAGDVGKIKNFIKIGINVNVEDETGRTALDYAGGRLLEESLQRERNEVVSVLIEAGAKVNANLLCSAANHGRVKLVSLLIKADPDVNVKDTCGTTAIQTTWNVEIVSLLMKADADVNAKDNSGRTVLHHHHNIEILSLLIKANADVNAKDNFGGNVLRSSGGFVPNVETFSFLVQNGAKMNTNDSSFFSFATTNEVEMASRLLALGYDVNYICEADGNTALHHVCSNDDSLDYDDYSLSSMYPYNPRIFENLSDQKKMILVLLQNHANIFIENDEGKTPIDVATPEALEILRQNFQTFIQNSLPKPWELRTETIGEVVASFIFG